MEAGDAGRLEIWGGLECTLNRVGDQYFDQIDIGRRHGGVPDLSLLTGLGIAALRYPVLWEKIAPGDIADAQWAVPDGELSVLKNAGIKVIAGLVHHGSGPAHTSLLDPDFPVKLAAYAGTVAARYPWIEDWTPINEPLTTARFSGLYGLWYPHRRDDTSFVQALLNQCRAIVLSMQAIRAINPRARLVQTDDLGKNWGTQEMAQVVGFYNERRWLAWDLLCGTVGPAHPLWRYLTDAGADDAALQCMRENPCPPDVIGINYYVTSERWLDHRPGRFPHHAAGMVDGRPCVDVEAARAMASPIGGVAPLLVEAWERYRISLAVTEAHIDAGREDQLRWFKEIYSDAQSARASGVHVEAVTAWSLFGAFNWNSLVTRDDGYYESGVFDLRSSSPRPTALAGLLRGLSLGVASIHPAAAGAGWWRRRIRLSGIAGEAASESPHAPSLRQDADTRPILISGASGTLGRAFAKLCAHRNVSFRLLSRSDMDITDPDSVARALDRHQPWAVVNASGYVKVDEAERDAARCFRENAWGAEVLAAACADRAVHLTTFSSDMVFDGTSADGYVESDAVSPINIYGRSKAEAEEAVLARCPSALVVRTSSFFGPWDQHNFVTKALSALGRGGLFEAPHDLVITPTYVPDLVNTCLDLIIDGASGVWHLTNGEALSWFEFARRAAHSASVDGKALFANHSSHCGHLAPRPANSALRSSRGIYLPSLQHAIDRYASQLSMARP